jgi:YwqJ-like deaminase
VVFVKKRLGPAVAGVLNTKNGKVYFGVNDPKGNLPEIQHPIIKDRIENMPDDILHGYIKTKNSGSHAEVYALNQALLENPNSKLDDFMIHVISTKGLGPKIPETGMPMPRCPHCDFITSGTQFFPEVIKNGK